MFVVEEGIRYIEELSETVSIKYPGAVNVYELIDGEVITKRLIYKMKPEGYSHKCL
jgi:hypothetical protein